MKKNKLVVWIGLIVVLSAIAVGIFKKCRIIDDGNSLRIGAILPLTGAQSHDGNEIKNALKIAVEEHNRNHSNDRIQLQIQDGKYSTKDSISAFNMLMDERPDVIIVGGSVVAIALAPLAEKNLIPMIALMAADDELPLINDWVFRMFPSDKEEINLISEFLRKNIKAYNICMLTVDNIQGATAAKWFKESLAANGGLLSGIETFPVDGADMRPQISKLLTRAPDAIYVFGYGLGFSAAVNQIFEMGYQKDLFTLDVMALDMYQQAVRNVNGDIYYTAPIFDGESDDARNLITMYQNMCNEKPSFFAGYAYETIRLLGQVYLNGAKSAKDIRDSLMQVNRYQSVVGELSFGGKRGVRSSLKVYRFNENGVQAIDRY